MCHRISATRRSQRIGGDSRSDSQVKRLPASIPNRAPSAGSSNQAILIANQQSNAANNQAPTPTNPVVTAPSNSVSNQANSTGNNNGNSGPSSASDTMEAEREAIRLATLAAALSKRGAFEAVLNGLHTECTDEAIAEMDQLTIEELLRKQDRNFDRFELNQLDVVISNTDQAQVSIEQARYKEMEKQCSQLRLRLRERERTLLQQQQAEIARTQNASGGESRSLSRSKFKPKMQ